MIYDLLLRPLFKKVRAEYICCFSFAMIDIPPLSSGDPFELKFSFQRAIKHLE